MVDKAKLEEHWAASRKLLYIVLIIWFFFAYLIHLFVGSLNAVSLFGFPFGYYMAAQGSLFAFVLLIFWFANRQNAIDEKFGLAEEQGGDA